jgi:hypothetical protein
VGAISQSYKNFDEATWQMGSVQSASPSPLLQPFQVGEFSEVDEVAFRGQLKAVLNFLEINRREEGIPFAYQQTFDWIFEPSPDEQEWSSFSTWLPNDVPLYWITGKAGSGKSTLMKFITDHHRTRELLKFSKSSSDLYLLSFYFWNSGALIQMSGEGLLRTFLHRILCDMPNLARLLFPQRFEIYVYFGKIA